MGNWMGLDIRSLADVLLARVLAVSPLVGAIHGEYLYQDRYIPCLHVGHD